MTAYGVSSMFFHEYPSAEIFSHVSRAGLDGIEYWLETPYFWLSRLPTGEVAACRQAHPEIATFTVHTPVLDLNPCSINPDVAEVSVAWAVRSLALARELGAGLLTVHPGRRTAKRPPGDADQIRFDHYLAVLKEAARKSTVTVAMENMEPAVNALICTPERMREVLDAEPWLKFTLDTSHALVSSEETVSEYIDLCGDRLANVHLSRAAGGRLHLPLEESPVMARILGFLRDHHYLGPLMLEIDDLNFPRPFSHEEKCAVLARDLRFMRECVEQG
ncbi:Xylose isomerase domain protein TIM barrel [Methanoregula boonei 6A8]|uniref:Xylose isomerase domain protein TIM barrel n=1 Tax=Methanoregula boonei (strain DSM 21154 / JCM 14090 / 6A8) TaxID=456442 RepID=A7I9J6_METB6|nr:sugar phosphate isomerase/epimerase family protein [Methanoregula boonei]ABS56407.1 Xylose isomerase domain protein TIM barrel [Methanoregula boonei 6A8]